MPREIDRLPWPRQFESMTGVAVLPRRANRLRDGVARRDTLFPRVACLLFDQPRMGPRLERQLPVWLKASPQSEQLWALAGYIHYSREHYDRAAHAFQRAATLSPRNLDNWLDLAMAFRHLGDSLGTDIILDHPLFIRRYLPSRDGPLTPRVLRRLRGRIQGSNACYQRSYHRFIHENGAS